MTPKRFWISLLLLMLLNACGASPTTYVPVSLARCALPAPAAPPKIEPIVCGEHVCLTPADSDAIWLYVRDTLRWQEKVALCGTINTSD